jgi:hypothetical protein
MLLMELLNKNLIGEKTNALAVCWRMKEQELCVE